MFMEWVDSFRKVRQAQPLDCFLGTPAGQPSLACRLRWPGMLAWHALREEQHA